MHRVDSTGLNWGVVAFLTVLTYALLGVGGLAILAAATAVGSVPLHFGVRRAQLMGFFLVPVMLFYSGYQEQLVDWLSIGQRTAPLLPTITLTGIALATGPRSVREPWCICSRAPLGQAVGGAGRRRRPRGCHPAADWLWVW